MLSNEETLESNKSRELNILEYHQKLLTEYREYLNNANKQINHTLSIYKLLAAILGTIITVALTSALYLYGNNMANLRQDINDQVKNVNDRVQSEIKDKMKTDSIQILIESEAQAQVKSHIDPIVKVYYLIPMANYSINHYDQLVKIASQSYPNFPDLQQAALEAVKQVKTVLDAKYREGEFDSKYDSFVHLAVLGSKPIDWTIEEFRNNMPLLQSSSKAICLDYVWKQNKRFSKYERLNFINEILESEKDVTTIYVACALMNEEAKLNKDFLSEKNEYLQWWKTKKETYRE